MAAPTYTLPALGSDTSVSDPLIRTALSDLKTLLTDGINDDNIATGGIGSGSLATNAVTATKIQDAVITDAKLTAGTALANLASASVTDAKLASPNNGTYKTLISGRATTYADMTAQNYLLAQNHQFTSGVGGPAPLQTGSSATTFDTSADLLVSPPILYLDNADYDVASLSTKLRVRAQVLTNGTAWSSVTATFGLYPITTSGSADNIAISLGTVVAGSTAAIANPAANSPSSAVGTDFAFPSDGVYGLGMALSATLTNNAAAILMAQLQVRNTT